MVCKPQGNKRDSISIKRRYTLPTTLSRPSKSKLLASSEGRMRGWRWKDVEEGIGIVSGKLWNYGVYYKVMEKWMHIKVCSRVKRT